MKTIIILALLVIVSSADMTMKKYKECVAKEEAAGTICDQACQDEYRNECLHDTEVYHDVYCKYWFRNVQVDENKHWSEEMAQSFHVCWDLCIEEIGGNTKKYVEMLKDCGTSVLNIVVSLISIALILII